MVIQVQQIAEEMLKSVLEVVSPNPEQNLKSHNLRNIYKEIVRFQGDFECDEITLSYLKDFYYDAKYPGENYIDVDRSTCDKCLNIMYDIIGVVNNFREATKMDIMKFNRYMTGYFSEDMLDVKGEEIL